MKVLLDTNIVLDLLMDRAQHADAAAELFTQVERGTVTGYLCATTVTTVWYLVAKAVGAGQAQVEIGKLLSMFEVASVTRQVLEYSLDAGFGDFEDAVLHEAACHAGADAIVTRNQKDFRNSRIPVHTAEEMASVLTSRTTMH